MSDELLHRLGLDVLDQKYCLKPVNDAPISTFANSGQNEVTDNKPYKRHVDINGNGQHIEITYIFPVRRPEDQESAVPNALEVVTPEPTNINRVDAPSNDQYNLPRPVKKEVETIHVFPFGQPQSDEQKIIQDESSAELHNRGKTLFENCTTHENSNRNMQLNMEASCSDDNTGDIMFNYNNRNEKTFKVCKRDVRAMLFLLYKMKMKPAEAARFLNKTIGTKCCTDSTAYNHFRRYAKGDVSFHPKKGSGRQCSIDPDALIRIVTENPHISSREISRKMSISFSSAARILRNSGYAHDGEKWFKPALQTGLTEAT